MTRLNLFGAFCFGTIIAAIVFRHQPVAREVWRAVGGALVDGGRMMTWAGFYLIGSAG